MCKRCIEHKRAAFNLKAYLSQSVVNFKAKIVYLCALVAEDNDSSLFSLPKDSDPSLIVKASSPNMHGDKN